MNDIFEIEIPLSFIDTQVENTKSPVSNFSLFEDIVPKIQEGSNAADDVHTCDIFEPSLYTPEEAKYRAEYIRNLAAKIGTILVDDTEAGKMATEENPPKITVRTEEKEDERLIIFKFSNFRGKDATIKDFNIKTDELSTPGQPAIEMIKEETEEGLNVTLDMKHLQGPKGDPGDYGVGRLTVGEFEKLKTEGKVLMDRWYFVTSNTDNILHIYAGSTLIAKSDASGNVFPLVFPFSFTT